MKRNLNLYLKDILIAINLIERYIKNFNFERFKRDRKNQDAIIRRLEIIGEAMKKIPYPFKVKYSNVMWQEFTGIRDFLSHVYFGVNISKIWDIVKKNLPELKKQIEEILNLEKEKVKK